MQITALLPALLLATAAVAHHGSGGTDSSGSDSSGSASSSSTSSTVAAIHALPTSSTADTPANGELIVQIVSVSDADGSLAYFPNSVQAPVGSIVQFQFHPKNHTVTESTFANPCVPVAQSNASLVTTTRPGLKSGFVPVTANDTETPVYNVLINDTDPIWVYCGQVNHCAKGMAMVINQNLSSTDKTIEAYIAAAAQLALVSTSTSTATAATTSTTSLATSIATAAATTDSSTTTSTSSSTSVATFTGAAAALVRPLQHAGRVAVAGALAAALL